MPVTRKPKKISYTQLTLRKLRDEGCVVDKVEKFNAYAGPFGRREDLFGFIDIIALRPGRIVGIQSTGPSGHADHKRKICACPYARDWIEAGGLIELWSWRKLAAKPGGKALRWQPRIETITEDMLDVGTEQATG
jgi:hypothetical protein